MQKVILNDFYASKLNLLAIESSFKDSIAPDSGIAQRIFAKAKILFSSSKIELEK